MLAESIHSVADSGNQVLLLLGGRRARPRRDPGAPVRLRPRALHLRVHRLGRAVQRRRPVRALRGLPQGAAPGADRLVAVGADRWSWSSRSGWSPSRSAPRSTSPTRCAATLTWVQFIRRAKAPELPVVLLEDFAALIGLVFALFGVGLTLITDDGVWDGIGTSRSACCWSCVAVVLAVETKSLLLGEGATPEAVARITAALVADAVGRAGHPHAHPAPRPGGAAGRRQDRGAPDDTRGRGGARHRRRRGAGSGRPCRSPG